MNSLAVVSLLFLVVAIVIGYVKKLNIGLVALGLSLILGTMGGLTAKQIKSGFSSSLFLTLLGTMIFFGVLEKNGTIDLLTKKLIKLIGNKAYLMPIAVLIISYVLSGMGPGALTTLAIMQGLVVVLSVRAGLPPVLMAVMSSIGCCTGSFTPIAISSIITRDLAAAQGIMLDPWKLLGAVSAINLTSAVIIYFVFKGHKIKFTKEINDTEESTFNSKQKMSLAMLVVLAVAVIGFKLDIGFVSFALTVVLIALKAGTQKEAFASVPWGILVLITGVGVLMHITLELGGIQLLADLLSKIMNKTTAAPILSLTASIMSFFSSVLGVVIPTLIPTVPMLIQNLGGGIDAFPIIVAICAGAPMAAISPLSTGGALSLAAFVQNAEDGEEKQDSVFKGLFIGAALSTVLAAALSLVGVGAMFA